ncbi:glycosyltransferase family 4 protein [Streptomyces sp. MP131-18]|uniref:glycosyltransferase family 4 protein n=1 Tax=Streptomyces sp. MP131-18 TaxID=1857892 RepID=UPI00097C8A25|nr:glycosyltransferase family 4 protein [Streptomyces sp. MP131-18]ONK15452.1 putative poly(glycerol-phosphate) alpha-glucosyltransferase [Streptomyces sp. MP131-18]
MKIRYLLLHAYGMGGTIRTVITQANAMAAAGHDVELVSVLRRRDKPHFAVDSRVRLRTLADLRPGARAPHARGVLGRYRARRTARLAFRPPRHIPFSEPGHKAINRQIELAVIHYLSELRDGIVVTTRPALNILAAEYATGGVIRVAQEHVNLGTHKEDLRAAIIRCYPRLDAVAVLTSRDREDYLRMAPGTRVTRIPNAVHSLRQKPSTCASHIALAAGRLRPQKGFDLLIEAFAQLIDEFPDWQLRIYGTGDRHDQLRALIDQHHLYNHVLLMGRTDQLDEEMAKASMYVLSSRYEGLPMVLIEAMSHGLPVVSYDCPTGPADVISDGKEGLLLPPGDVPALAEGMRRLMGDEGLRARMGDAALGTVERYSPEAIRGQWTELFDDLLAERRAHRGL